MPDRCTVRKWFLTLTQRFSRARVRSAFPEVKLDASALLWWQLCSYEQNDTSLCCHSFVTASFLLLCCIFPKGLFDELVTDLSIIISQAIETCYSRAAFRRTFRLLQDRWQQLDRRNTLLLSRSCEWLKWGKKYPQERSITTGKRKIKYWPSSLSWENLSKHQCERTTRDCHKPLLIQWRHVGGYSILNWSEHMINLKIIM